MSNTIGGNCPPPNITKSNEDTNPQHRLAVKQDLGLNYNPTLKKVEIRLIKK